MKRIWSIMIICLVCACMLISMVACDEGIPQDGTTPSATEAQNNAGGKQTPSGSASQNGSQSQYDTDNPIVQFKFSTGDVITVELYPDKAPITVENFLKYVEEGFYKGTVIHRIDRYVVQGGGYVIEDGNYVQKTTTHPAIKGEFAINGVTNPVSHTAGAISMARTTQVNSATSQFFFCPIDQLGWDGSYAAFGHVVDQSSLDSIVRLSQAETIDGTQYPAYSIIITSVTILQK